MTDRPTDWKTELDRQTYTTVTVREEESERQRERQRETQLETHREAEKEREKRENSAPLD